MMRSYSLLQPEIGNSYRHCQLTDRVYHFCSKTKGGFPEAKSDDQALSIIHQSPVHQKEHDIGILFADYGLESIYLFSLSDISVLGLAKFFSPHISVFGLRIDSMAIRAHSLCATLHLIILKMIWSQQPSTI